MISLFPRTRFTGHSVSWPSPWTRIAPDLLGGWLVVICYARANAAGFIVTPETRRSENGTGVLLSPFAGLQVGVNSLVLPDDVGPWLRLWISGTNVALDLSASVESAPG